MTSTVFESPDSAERTLQRISDLTGVEFPLDLFSDSPAPDQALQNLERWLNATSSPGFQAEQILNQVELGQLLIFLLGASQPVADSLIQNPELASIVFDPAELARVPTAEDVMSQGRRLLDTATSFSHALDRLRFLKQRWMLPIVVNDLSRGWPEPVVWQSISSVAEALIALSLDVVWKERKGEVPFPLMVVGFGKLGGGELNYSSDIDLVYVHADGSDERDIARTCEALNRALTDRMGRGQLYRVDLRLRPFGGAGSISSSMRGIESYYDLYAQPWEIQALLRSKVIAGPPDMAAHWEAIRERHCFRSTLSADSVDEALEMRARTEADADASDIKRSSGGIRDVEFLVQILQMAHGFHRPGLRVKGTLEALRALEAEGILDHATASSLERGYVFLRQLEHRLQFVGDQQTHNLPSSPAARERLARMMGATGWPSLEKELDMHRVTVGSLYRSTLHPQTEIRSDRDVIAQELGPLAQAGLQWFDVLPESASFYSSLTVNADSLVRVARILRDAPRLVPAFKQSVALTEMLISGEIEEDFNSAAIIEAVPLEAVPRQVAEVYSTTWAHVIARWVLTGEGDLGQLLSDLAASLLRHCAKRLYAEFDIIGLGSLALGDYGVESDSDVLLLVNQPEHQQDAEMHAQFLLSLLSQLKRLGAPVEIDLRLRPEGGKGLLARTYQGFSQYELEAMEMWERFALGQSQLVFGDGRALHLVRKAAYAQPLTPERLKELLAMKKRIETERVPPQYVRREVKLGYGSLSDIEWLVHLHEMRYPTATKAGEAIRMDDRIRSLGRAGLLNAVEVEQLLAARKHLLEVRIRLALHGLKKDLLPENPDKLDRLAQSLGHSDGNSFLAVHENVLESVRAIYVEGLERLKA